MKAQKLTNRQLDLLHTIEEFFSKNGVPPTIVEMKEAMKVKSDQSIYQLLEKLEKAGVISREPGKRRSIRLKKTSSSGVEDANQNSYISTNESALGFAMNPTQKEIFNKLHEIDPQVAQIFKGAVYTLSIKDNHPDWIPPVANAIRHIFGVLTRPYKQVKGENKSNDSSGINQISKAFDPYGNISNIEKAAWAHWNTLNEYFASFSHYPDEYFNKRTEFLSKVDELYELLLQYVLPDQHKIYEKIDQLFVQGVTKTGADEIGKLLSRNTATYTYFFNNVDNCWFEFLRSNKFLKPKMQVGQFLVKIADKNSDQLIDLIKKYRNEYKIDDQSRFIRQYFVSSAIQMSIDKAVQVVGILSKQKWVEDIKYNHDFLIYECNKLLEFLIQSGKKEAALLLAKNILKVRKSKEPKSRLREINGYADNYQYGEIINTIKGSSVSDYPEYIKLLVNKLNDSIKLSDDNGQYSQIWRSSIAVSESYSDDVMNRLLDGIIFLLEKHLAECKSKKINIVKEIDSLIDEKAHAVFLRIKLYFYAKYPNDCLDGVGKLVIDFFNDHEAEKELDELLTSIFGKLKQTVQNNYLALISEGPKIKEKDDNYARYWKLRKFYIIRDQLKKEWKDIYSELLNGDDESKFTPHYSGVITSWTGPTAPKKSQELDAVSLENLIEYLITWNPKKGFEEPSRMGLGRELAEAVKNNSEKYSKNALLFKNENLHPIYIYKLFFGLREALRAGGIIEWVPVLELMKIYVDRAKSNELAEIQTDEDGWNNCFQYMADLLENGLSSSKQEIPFSLKEVVWEVIEYVCENREPDLEHEQKYGGDNSDYYTISINTARGEAFHALFNYIFWHDRHLKKKNNSRITEEAKQKLLDHLNIKKEPGLTIRSVYGRFFPWIFIYDKKWTENIIENLFPINDLERRCAAWKTYLINAVYPEIFEKLRPQYEQAINELQKTSLKKNRRPVDLFQRLVEHLMIAYFYEIIEYDDPLLQLLDTKANREQKSWAVNFSGRVYIASENAVRDSEPSKERLRIFWDKRLKESRTTDELKEFGWWLRVGFFDNEWMLETLLETLNQTKGIIDPDYRVLEVLNSLAEDYSLLVSQCLLRMVKAKYQDRFLRITREKNVLDIVKKLYLHKDADVRKLIIQISDYMLRLGNNDFRMYAKEENDTDQQI